MTTNLDSRLAEVAALFAAFNRCDAPGCVVGVALEGRVVFRQAFGLASVQHGVANTPRTRMRIASTSKHFTCLAALMLAEEGKLDIDAPVGQVLPDLALPTLQGMPTLRQFMNHTSGWRCGLDLSMVGNALAPMPPGWMPKAVARQQGVNFAPGHGQIYANTGYHLLSMAIDRAAGMPLEAFLKARVFTPMGMDDTEGVPSDMHVTPDRAANHDPDPAGGWRHARGASDEIRGEGNLVSSLDDMLRWLAHLRGPKRVGSEAAWAQMLAPTVLADGSHSPYGLGLVRHSYRGVKVVEHPGGVPGGNNQMLTVPAHALDIVLMTNGLPLSMRDMATQIVEILLAEHLSPPEPKAVLARYPHLVGTRYHGPSGRTLEFGAAGAPVAADAGDAPLGLRFMAGPPFMPLRDEGDSPRLRYQNTTTCDLTLCTAELAATADGQAPATLTLRDGPHTERLVRLPATPPTAQAAGAAWLGHWWCHDLQAEAEIAFDGDTLVLWLRGEYSGKRRLVLTPLADRVFGLLDPESPFFGHMVLSRQDVGGPIATRFELNGARTRHLAFVRPTPTASTAP